MSIHARKEELEALDAQRPKFSRDGRRKRIQTEINDASASVAVKKGLDLWVKNPYGRLEVRGRVGGDRCACRLKHMKDGRWRLVGSWVEANKGQKAIYGSEHTSLQSLLEAVYTELQQAAGEGKGPRKAPAYLRFDPGIDRQLNSCEREERKQRQLTAERETKLRRKARFRTALGELAKDFKGDNGP